jgi:hypothetical protein
MKEELIRPELLAAQRRADGVPMAGRGLGLVAILRTSERVATSKGGNHGSGEIAAIHGDPALSQSL